MRLLKLEFENVNSLAGQWSIDFGHPAFEREGLFAIVGPTGSGKTSILDAISLALYGKTARQEKATTAELGEVMTHDTTRCSSKISFVGVDGGKYRAEWSIARKTTRKGTDGGVTSSTIRFYRLEPEEDITPQMKDDIAPLIVEKVGLDFAQFQRSMMLAQGQFDKFLTASDADRAGILAQAAGTDIFTRIGTRIFEKWQAAAQKVANIKLRQGENIPLSPEQRQDLEEKRRTAAETAREANQRLEMLQEEWAWLREEERLKTEKEKLEKRSSDLETRRRDLAPGDRMLAVAEDARSLRDKHVHLTQLRKAEEAANDDVSNARQDAEAADRQARDLGEAIPGLEKRWHDAEEARQTATPIIGQATRLEAEIIKAQGEEKTAKANFDAAEEGRKRLAGELAGLARALEIQEAERGYLSALRDSPETSAPETVEAELVTIARKRAILKKHAADVVSAAKKAMADFEDKEAEFDRAKAIHSAEQPQIDARVKDAARICGVMKAMDYDEVRAKLRSGDRCPVCGKPIDDALASDMPPASEFEKAYDDAVAAKEASEAAYNAARDRRNEAETVAMAAERKRKDETEELEQIERRLAERETQVKTMIQEETERQARLRRELEEADRIRKTRAEELETAKGKVVDLVGKRRDLNLPDDLAGYGKSLDNAVDTAKQAFSEGQNKVAAANAKRDQLRETRDGLLAKAATAARARTEAEGDFSASFGAKGFADEAAWRAACGEDGVLDEVRRRREELAKDTAALEEARRKFDADMALHAANVGSERQIVEVDQDIREAKARRSEAERESGSFVERITSDDICREKAGQLEKDRVTAEANLLVWKRLNDMLGGKGGFRFSQYAQGLTLRTLLDAANPFLAHMTAGRYSLIWRPPKPEADDKDEKEEKRARKKAPSLLPLIKDHDQHDTIRPISNVSGGERFEVSLALALGLSKLNAGRVKVETMFLDEGFGTLDPERLEAALDVICGLHSEGTTIGVISHIKAVENRLPLKIRVEPAGVVFGRLVGEGAIEHAVSGGAATPSATRRKTPRPRKPRAKAQAHVPIPQPP